MLFSDLDTRSLSTRWCLHRALKVVLGFHFVFPFRFKLDLIWFDLIYLGLDEDEGILSQVLAESQQEYLESLKRKAEEEKVNILFGIMDLIRTY